MKRLLAILIAVLAVNAFADSYMYWMVGDSITLDGQDFDGYTSAKVGVFDDATGAYGSYLNLYSWDNSLGTDTYKATPGDNSALYANITGMTGKSFYIELFNGDTSVGRSSELLSYASAEAYATGFGMDKPVSTPWVTMSFTSQGVPEPSSAVLMMIGCAVLGLRRRRLSKKG